MKNQFFTICATILCAQSGFAAELITSEEEKEPVCWPLVTGKKRCAEERPTYDEVPASCCYFYTETAFSGDFFEVCATDFYQEGFIDVPLSFFVKGIESWSCGENTQLLIEEVEEREDVYCPFQKGKFDESKCTYDRKKNSFTSQAWSSSDYSLIYNSDVSASKGSIVNGAKEGKITSVYLLDSSQADDNSVMDTTLFEQADCTGRSWGLTYESDHENLEPKSWDAVMKNELVSLDDDLRFKSVLVTPDSELTIVTDTGLQYLYTNRDAITGQTRCYELPKHAKISGYTYIKLDESN